VPLAICALDAGFFDDGHPKEPPFSDQGDLTPTAGTAMSVASGQANNPQSEVT
jgi:hypothetical protein